jgi:hypothetical protein
MSDKKLQIEEYRQLLQHMHSLCEEMPEIIFTKYFDSNKYLYSLYNEAFNSIKGFCVLLGNGALIPQACVVLRMALEHTATIRVLELHKELQDDYIEHHKFRFQIRNEENRTELIKEHYDGKFNPKKENPLKFLEYGWLKSLNEDYGFNLLIELSKIQEQDNAIQNWKEEFNYWTHGIIQFTNLTSDINAPIIYSHTLISLAAKLLDILVYEFNNENKFDFVIGFYVL